MRLVLAACSVFLAAATPVFASEQVPQPVANQAPVDPARLAAARTTVDYVWPLGTYARMMNGTMDKMMDAILDSTMQLPIKDLAGIGGVDTAKLGSGSLAQIMEIYDPAYKERLRLTTRTMMAEMTTMMTQFEPEIRDGLSQAYAMRFDAKQLADLNTFFATPTGKAYAADSYMIMMSPEVMTKMQTLMPRIMEQMPAIVDKVKTSTASLPRQRAYAELTAAEKDKLSNILGVQRAELDKREAAKSDAQAALEEE